MPSSIAASSLPLRSSTTWQEHHADLSIWPATKRPLAVLVFICGNPGLVAYYDTFLSSLHATSPQYWEVIGLGHLGHSPKHPAAASSAIGWRNSTNGGGLPSLQDQIDSKVDFIDSLRLQFDEEARIILLGHSVGAYICQELMKKRPKLVHAMYGLFPTITHIADTPNGRRLAPLFRNEIRIAVTALLFLVNFLLPFRMLVLLVRLTTGQKRPAAHTTSRMLKAPPVVSAAIMMAADEMKCIRDLDTDFLEERAERIVLYFAAGDTDGWVGSQARVSRICKCLDKGKAKDDPRDRWHICQKGMQHAFCLEHSESMAELCAKWVAIDLLRPVEAN